MENRPKQIKIGYFTVKIRYCEDMDGLHGDYDSNKKEIRLSVKQTEEQIRENLMHELLHALLDDAFAFEDDVDKEKEEKATRIVSPKIMEVFTENKKLRKYLFEPKDNA